MAETDKELQEAMVACAKIIEEKCGMKPYMLVITKADVYYISKDEEKKKGKFTGKASYVYMTKPKLGKDGISKLLIDTTRIGLNAAERKIVDESG